MIQSEHIKSEDLRELLESESDSSKSRKISLHLQECAQCREKLEALSAGTNFWQAAPENLKQIANSSRFSTDFSSNTEAFPRSKKEQRDPGLSDSDGFPFSITEILDPPNHPEMLGRLGKYEVEREIGRGGMGVVLKAHDSELNRPLAIKVLAPHLASHGTARKRFAQEARSAAGVIHPNVIDVYGVSNEGKTPYIVMPYIAGQSLQKLVDSQGPLPEIEITRIALQISAGLAAAHSQGLVHRDIKPANILVEQDVSRVLITDFGLARAEDDASLTRTGWLTGTPNYMSPEQARGQKLDARSDLFSLGSLMYFLATGRLPFRAESPLGVLHRIQNDHPNSVRSINNEISRTLQDMIEVLHEKEIDKRFASAGVLHDVLEKHLAYLHQPEVFQPPTVKTPERFWTQRKLAIVGTLAGIGLIAASGFFLPALGQWNQNPFAPLMVTGQQDPKPNSANFAPFSSENSGPFGDQQDLTPQDQVQDTPPKKLTAEERKKGKELYREGYDHYKDGEYSQAIELFQKAAKFDNVKPESIYNIACCYALEGKKDAALDYLQKAVKNRYDDYHHYQRDSDLDSLRKDDRFKKILTGLKLRHKNDQLVSRASSLMSDKDYQSAEKLCRKALKSEPGHARATFLLGYFLHMQGKLEEAEKWHIKATYSPNYRAIALYNLSCLASLRKQDAKALEYFQKATKVGLAEELSTQQIETDPDLNHAKKSPEFQRALKRVRFQRKKWQGQHLLISRGMKSGSSIPFLGYYQDGGAKGKWEIDSIDQMIELELIRGSEEDDWHWRYSRIHEPSDFEGKLGEATTKLAMPSEYGKLVLTGKFTKESGSGTYQFVGSEEFKKKLQDKGVKEVSDSLLFRFFVSKPNLNKEIENLKALQDLNVDQKTLSILMAEGVRSSLVKGYLKHNLSIKSNLTFVLSRVDSSLLMSYKAMDFDLDKYRKFIQWRVQPKLIKSYMDSGFDLDKNEEFIKWRVPGDFLAEYKKNGFAPLDHSFYVRHRIPSELMKEYKDAGFDLETYKDHLRHRTPAQLLSDYKKAGLNHEKFARFITRHIPASMVKEYQSNNFDVHEHFDYLQHRTPISLLKDYQKNGLDLWEYETHVKQHVDPSLIKEYLKNDLSPDKYRKFVRSNVAAEKVKDYINAGLDPDAMSRYVRANVSASLIKKYVDKGLDPKKYRRQILRGIGPEDVSKK